MEIITKYITISGKPGFKRKIVAKHVGFNAYCYEEVIVFFLDEVLRGVVCVT